MVQKRLLPMNKTLPVITGMRFGNCKLQNKGEVMRERSGRNGLASCVIEVKIAGEIIRRKE